MPGFSPASALAGAGSGAASGAETGNPWAAVIGGGLGLFQALLGHHAQQAAAKQQQAAQKQAQDINFRQLAAQTATADYGQRMSQAHNLRNTELGNALLASYGVTGLTIPQQFYEAPPNLIGILKGAGGPARRAAMPGTSSMADLYGGPAAPPQRPSLADLYGG